MLHYWEPLWTKAEAWTIPYVKQILWYAAGRKMNSYNHFRNTVAGKIKLKYVIFYYINFPSLYFHKRHKPINEQRGRYSKFSLLHYFL